MPQPGYSPTHLEPSIRRRYSKFVDTICCIEEKNFRETIKCLLHVKCFDEQYLEFLVLVCDGKHFGIVGDVRVAHFL